MTRYARLARLVGGEDYSGAALACEELLKTDPADLVALSILSLSCERLGRLPEALASAEQAVGLHPGELTALQAVARVSVALDQHDKAAKYLRLALALPEVVDERPRETPRAILFVTRLMSRVPFVQRRVRAGDLAYLEPSTQLTELTSWKHWAEGYLAWYEGRA